MSFTPEFSNRLELIASSFQSLGEKCTSTEEIAAHAIDLLYAELSAGEDDPCALLRFFRTVFFNELTPDLKAAARLNLGDKDEMTVNCLTLLASRGIVPEWNDRSKSTNHKVIPLVSKQMIESAPMVAQLIKRLGIDVAQVLAPESNLFLNPKSKTYNVLYVPEATGDQTIVSQQGFVEPYKIRSVIGFGGLLPTGDMFAIMMFMRVFVSAEIALKFTMLARSLEIAINSMRSGKRAGARVLIAADNDTADRLRRVFGELHNLRVVSTIDQALAASRSEIFDMIICGVSFDDSRMFDLLQAVKSNRTQRSKPFICYKQSAYPLGDGIESGVVTAARIIGASCYLDGTSLTDAGLLGTLETYLPEAIWVGAR